MESLISIIIPVYNVEQYLPECLESILEQDYANWECILVDDGSKDRSGDIIDEFSQRDSRFHVIHDVNHGVSHARNKGLGLAKGDWICFVDSDDSIVHNALSHMLWINISNNADVCICPIIKDKPTAFETIILDSKEKEQLIWSCLAYRTDKYTSNGLLVDAPHAKLFKAKIINEHKLRFVEQLCKSEDAVFNAEFYYYSSRIVVDSYPLYRYTQNPNSICHNYKLENIPMFEMLINEEKKLVDDWMSSSPIYNNVLRIRSFIALEQVMYENNANYQPISCRVTAIRMFMGLESVSTIIKSTKYCQLSSYLSGRSKKIDLFLVQNGCYHTLCFWTDLQELIFKSRVFVGKTIKKILGINQNVELANIIHRRDR